MGDGALGDEVDAVHVRRSSLQQTVPVDGGALCRLHGVVHVHHDLVAFTYLGSKQGGQKGQGYYFTFTHLRREQKRADRGVFSLEI